MRDFSDQAAIFDPSEFPLDVHVIGLGGSGSAVFRQLLAEGFRRIVLYDDDVVEERNTGNQLMYRSTSDLGRPKVQAALDYAIRQEADCEVIPLQARVTASTPLGGVVISCVDHMEQRRAIWEAVSKERPDGIFLFIDTRVGGETFTVLTLHPTHFLRTAAYEDTWLFDQDEAQEALYGARMVSHITSNLASQVVGQIVRYVRGMKVEFMLDFNMQNMVLTRVFPEKE